MPEKAVGLKSGDTEKRHKVPNWNMRGRLRASRVGQSTGSSVELSRQSRVYLEANTVRIGIEVALTESKYP